MCTVSELPGPGPPCVRSRHLYPGPAPPHIIFVTYQFFWPAHRSFDEAADGYGRGEGFAVVILHTGRSPACPILSSSAVNQDGRSSGLTAPSGPSQTSLIQKTLTGGRISGNEVEIVAVHGTGTALGDPIEVGALGRGYGVLVTASSLTLASNKSCFGHTEGAAGEAPAS